MGRIVIATYRPKPGREEDLKVLVSQHVDRLQELGLATGRDPVVMLAADGSVQTIHRSEVRGRYIYKHEMELLLRVAGFGRWEIYGDFDRRPLTDENDAMIVAAWRGA